MQVLLWSAARPPPYFDVIIHSDSMSALLILEKYSTRTYPETSSRVHEASKIIKDRGNSVILHWIPSHVGIPGNTKADKAASDATRLQAIEPVEQTLGAYTKNISTFTSASFAAYVSTHKTSSFAWYRRTTVPKAKILDSRLLDTQLRLLRFHLHTISHVTKGPVTCTACMSAVYSPAHYLITCPSLPSIRRNLLNHLPSDQHSLPSSDLAALFIRRAAILPEFLMPLFVKQPYCYQS